jgi:hypothetical protein
MVFFGHHSAISRGGERDFRTIESWECSAL